MVNEKGREGKRVEKEGRERNKKENSVKQRKG